jgi:uracil permease
MPKPRYIYDLDERPPLHYAVVYGLQWTVIVFPALIIVAGLGAKSLNMDTGQEVRFFQLILLTSGFFTALQTLWGHRYPLLDGPATALLLTFIILAPYGIETIQGGTILGGLLLVFLVLIGQLRKVVAYATPNVVGVILMLIAFTLLPYLVRSLSGVDASHPQGRVSVLLTSFALVLFMAALSHWLSGFLKSVTLLMGIAVGTLLFSVLELPGLEGLAGAAWLSFPSRWVSSRPSFYWPAAIALCASYLAVVVNSLGSLHGVANITETERLPSAVSRGILINGLAGIVCGFLGLIGIVSYSMSPGVILANRVASRFAVTWCGIILIVTAFVPKLAALLSMVPGPVVGAALCVAMGAQVGAGLAIVSSGGLSSRDYYVVGLPVLLGTMVGFLPEGLMAAMPTALRVFLGNGLIVGIFLVLALEHVIMRKGEQRES